VISYNTVAANGSLNTGWISGGIFISTSSNVQGYGNVISRNSDGIAVFMQNRGSGNRGLYTTSNVNFYNNSITMNEGFTAITGGAESDKTNKFTNNRYYLSGNAQFQIGGVNTNYTGWLNAGYN